MLVRPSMLDMKKLTEGGGENISKKHEHTKKESVFVIDSPHYHTKVWDDEGNKGEGRDFDKSKSIEKAHKNYRERK